MDGSGLRNTVLQVTIIVTMIVVIIISTEEIDCL